MLLCVLKVAKGLVQFNAVIVDSMKYGQSGRDKRISDVSGIMWNSLQ